MLVGVRRKDHVGTRDCSWTESNITGRDEEVGLFGLILRRYAHRRGPTAALLPLGAAQGQVINGNRTAKCIHSSFQHSGLHMERDMEARFSRTARCGYFMGRGAA
jgi:hypothetical protein